MIVALVVVFLRVILIVILVTDLVVLVITSLLQLRLSLRACGEARSRLLTEFYRVRLASCKLCKQLGGLEVRRFFVQALLLVSRFPVERTNNTSLLHKTLHTI
jgi:hypothetical protein